MWRKIAVARAPRARLLVARFCVLDQRNPVRPARVAQLRARIQQRAHDVDLTEHRGGEDVHPRATVEQEERDLETR
jgi:hypothetical protein